MPDVDWDFDFSEKPRNPNYMPPPVESDSEWLVDLYENILNMEVDPSIDDGHKYWMSELSKEATRDGVLNYFKGIASKENAEIVNKVDFEDLLDGDQGSRLAVVIPQSAGDVLMINSLMGNLKSLYPSHDIYVLSQAAFHPLIEDNPDVYKVLQYQEGIDDLLALEGRGSHKGYFDLAFLPHVGTQKIFNYQHNGKDKTQFALR
jgi:hypothetical protein